MSDLNLNWPPEDTIKYEFYEFNKEKDKEKNKKDVLEIPLSGNRIEITNKKDETEKDRK